MNTQFFNRLRAYPPVLIRLLARNSDETAMTDDDLVARGCPLPVIKHLSCSAEWTLPPKDCDDFLAACGADPLNSEWVKSTNRVLRRATKWSWLQRSPNWPEFRRMLVIYARHHE